jgi:hypothetical protein
MSSFDGGDHGGTLMKVERWSVSLCSSGIGWSYTPTWSWFAGGVLPQGYISALHGVTGVPVGFRGSIQLVLGRRRSLKDSFDGALAGGTTSSFPTEPGGPIYVCWR